MAGWAMAALGAGVLGWVGPYVIRRLPPSPDAEAETPSYQTLARAPRLSAWLALGAAVLMTIVALAVPPRLLPAWALVCGVGSWLFYIDWRTQLLPTRIIWPLCIVTVAAIAVEAWRADDMEMLVRAVVTSFVAFGVFWVFWWIAGLWKAGGFGYGDVRLAALLGLVLGSVGGWAAPVGLYLGILLGALVGVVLKMRGRAGAFALGPWMLLGAVLAPLVA